MPKLQVSRLFKEVDKAFNQGYVTVSEQGSSRSSKTYSNVMWLCWYCQNTPNIVVSIVRATLPALKASVYRDFEEIMKRLELWDKNRLNKSDLIYTFANGSFIEFFSCTDEQRMRGRKRDILFVNEANELKFIEWQQLQMRTTRFTIIDYNPSFSDDHWINLVNQEKDTYFFVSTYKDNPFLEEKIIKEIESLQWKNKSLWQVYGLGQRAIVEGLIFKTLDIVPDIPREARRRRFLGMDFGYSNDPTAIVEVAISGLDLYMKEICYRTHMLTSDIIRELKNAADDNWFPKVISESADPRLVDEIYNAGIDIHAVHKYQGSVVAGIQKMQEFRLHVIEGGSNLLKEFHNYTYRQDKEGKWLNEPIDAFNHCFSGETRIMTVEGWKEIKNISAGDSVLTSQGFKNVIKRWDNGKRKIINYTLVFSRHTINIKATPEHLVKTSKNWVKLKDLAEDMVLFTQNRGNRIEKSKLVSIFAEDSNIEEDVYDLEVEGCHEYCANGLMVHNCIDAIRYVIMEEVLGGYQNSTAQEIVDLI